MDAGLDLRFPDREMEAEGEGSAESESAEGVGYLLKDRIAEGDQLARAIREVAGGGSMLDPAIVQALVNPVAGKDVWRTVTVYQGGRIIHQKTYYQRYSHQRHQVQRESE